MSTLNTLAADILSNLSIAQFKPENPPSASEKRAAAFEIGHALKKARKEFEADQDYGDWCRCNIIEKCDTAIPRMTLLRYRMLAEFTDSLELAEKCGFTNIYKMMEDNDRAKDAKAWVLENHESMKKRELGQKIKEMLTGKIQVTPEAAAKVEAERWKRKYEEQQVAINENKAVSETTIVLAKHVLGLDEVEELSKRIIDTSFRRMAMLMHPDRGGTSQQMDVITKAKETLLSVIA